MYKLDFESKELCHFDFKEKNIKREIKKEKLYYEI